MQHPMVRPSLAPFGFVFPDYRERLNWRPEPWMYSARPERRIGKLWARLHETLDPKSMPIPAIVHEILPARYRPEAGDFMFAGKPYLSRDIMLLSTVAQWLGTNIGHIFLEDTLKLAPQTPRTFVEEFKRKERQYGLLVKFVGERPTARDRALAESFMRWLGSARGRAYAHDWLCRRARRQRFLQAKRLSPLAA